MSDSVRPHRWQPTRLRRPWDSPGKNTGVGCHFLLQCMKVESESEVAPAAYQAPPPVGFSRQEYWSGVPLPSLEAAYHMIIVIIPTYRFCLKVKAENVFNSEPGIYYVPTHSSVLAWRIPGMGTLVGCRLWGRTESDTTEAT